MNVEECGRAEWIPTRESLLSKVRDWNDQESWREFSSIYRPLIYHEARRQGLREPEAEDVAQEAMLAVAKAMPSFHYRKEAGSFKSWLFNLTRWRIRDWLRKQTHCARPAVNGSAGNYESTIEAVPDVSAEAPDETWDNGWKEGVLREAMQKVRRTVAPKNYQAFDLLVVHGWEPSKVARELCMSRARVYLAKQRISRAIRREIEVMGEKWQ